MCDEAFGWTVRDRLVAEGEGFLDRLDEYWGINKVF